MDTYADNPNAIYVPVEQSPVTMALALLAAVFLGILVWQLIGIVRAGLGGVTGRGVPVVTRGRLARMAVGLVGFALFAGLFVTNPGYADDQRRAGEVAMREIRDDFGLESTWEPVAFDASAALGRLLPGDLSEGQTADGVRARVGQLSVTVDGATYPVSLVPTTYTVRRNRGSEVRYDWTMLEASVEMGGRRVGLGELAGR